VFKFFQKLKVVGEGQKVGVVCRTKEQFDNWFRDLFFNESIVINNVLYHKDAKYYPIFSHSTMAGHRYNYLVILSGAELMRHHQDIMLDAMSRIING
jgi:hypothetical protein